jgi:hypothetical protein
VLHSDGVDVKTITKGLIYAVVPTSLEVHLGRGDLDAHRRIHSFRLMLVGSAFGGLRDSGKTYEKEFADRYLSHDDWQYAIGCPPVCEYLTTGHLDRASLVAQIRELFTPDNSERKPWERLLTDPTAMDDGDFQLAANQTIEAIREGQVTKPGVLVGLFDAFQAFVTHGLISQTNEQIVQTFSEGLRKSTELGTYEGDSLLDEVALNHPSLEPPTQAGKTFRDEVLKANERALRSRDEKRVLEARAGMTHDPKRFINQLVSTGESGLQYTAVFDKLDAKEVTSWIFGLSNGFKRHLQGVLQNRYNSPPPDVTFAAELPTLEEVRDELKVRSERVTNGKCTRMSEFLIRRLVETLTMATEHIQMQLTEESKTPQTEGKSTVSG